MNEENITYGRFEREMMNGPALEVECNNWDTLGEKITYGRFETDVVTGPAVEVDCSEWDQRILRVQFSTDQADSEEIVLSKLMPIMELVKACGFDWDRSSSDSEPGQFTIRVVPTNAAASERQEWLAEQLRPLFSTIRGVTKSHVEQFNPFKA